MSTRLRSPAADLPPDDHLMEVFLRLPPEPCHLYAASRVCRRWCRLVRCPTFLSRFRAFHRTPPVLGIFQNIYSCTEFVSTTAPTTEQTRPLIFKNREVLDCRHGRVLIINHTYDKLVIWDPIDDEAEYVSLPDLHNPNDELAGAVVCAAGHDAPIDCCHSCPFQVILFEWTVDEAGDDAYIGFGCVYSSKTGDWSRCTSTTFPVALSPESSALVGDSVYWKLELAEDGRYHLIQFNLPRQEVDTIELPYEVSELDLSNIRIMPSGDGGFGFAGVNGFSIQLWSRTIDSEVEEEWEMIRMIDMENLTLSGVPAGDMLLWSSVVGYAEDSDVLFLKSEAGVFMINLKSLQLKKVPLASNSAIYPYSSFYTRGCDIPGIDVDVMFGIKYQRKKQRSGC